ncbi:MAG: ATP-dependent DNA helicase RecG [Alphaproteobacteria bacterium]|nr:ATP-dependent DNA helicase RecG [Alphaproteobacteria bacterium]
MRPENLFELFSSITTLKGVGSHTLRCLEKLTGTRIRDLLFHLPNNLIQRTAVESLSAAYTGQNITIILTATQHSPPPGKSKNKPYRVHCLDEKGMAIDLIFFRTYGDSIARLLPIGVKRLVSGTVEDFNYTRQITHPDHVGSLDSLNDWVGLEGVYPLTQGITHKNLHKLMMQVLQKIPQLPEWIGSQRLQEKAWLPWNESLLHVHKMPAADYLDPLHRCRQRLAYDELLANQIALLLIRSHRQKQKGKSISGTGHLRNSLTDLLPFQLTDAQNKALREIYQDMESPNRMVRLLQGDVGSGKTIVAMMAMLKAIEDGYQTALLAPTEILAQQHFATLQPWAERLGICIQLLTSRTKGRPQLIRDLQDGKINILVGTHAIIQDDVLFKNLGFAVIDEQHRFGVEQRLKLSQKGQHVDVLVMTATPIPRTLMLAVYGDLVTSILDSKPPGRQEIQTTVMSLKKLQDIYVGIGRSLSQGQKVYWVCPLVEESEALDLAAATDRYVALNDLFPGQVGLVHGQMKGAEKDAAMEDFLSGKTRILVATTVIEVGVHVPDATIMVIEHAERFGLSQLHQLRGRIGRGELSSNCLLLYGQPLTATAQSRLKIMRESNDGFRIAEEDFRLRGGGDALGLRQSGMPDMKFVNWEFHYDLLSLAHKDALQILQDDPHLNTPHGQAIRVLLYLFEKDRCIHYLESG